MSNDSQQTPTTPRGIIPKEFLHVPSKTPKSAPEKSRTLEGAGKSASTKRMETKRNKTFYWAVVIVCIVIGSIMFGLNAISGQVKEISIDQPIKRDVEPFLPMKPPPHEITGSSMAAYPTQSLVEVVPSGLPPVSIVAKPTGPIRIQPWRMGPWTCIRSCGHGFVMVRVDNQGLRCMGPSDKECTWFLTPFCSQTKTGQAPMKPDSGMSCDGVEDGWCKEAKQVLLLDQEPSHCPQSAEFLPELDKLRPTDTTIPERTPGAAGANTVSITVQATEVSKVSIASADDVSAAGDGLDPSVQIAGDVKPSAWKCIYSCHEQLHVLVRDTGMGSIQCSGQNSLSCTWYEDDACRNVSVTSLPPVGERGMKCTRFWPGTWCSEAQSQLWYKNLQSTCPPNPVAPEMTSEYTCIQSCRDHSDFVRVRQVDGKVQCQGPDDASCSWFEDASCTKLNAGASAPVDTRGRVCDNSEYSVLGTWCANYKLVQAGNATDCMPKDYGCIVSCGDKGAAVRVRGYDLKCAGDIGGDSGRCTWYTDSACSQMAPGGVVPIPDGGRACGPFDFVQGLWCDAAKRVLWDGESPLDCSDIPPPPPVVWTCMQSCSNQGAYIQVRNGGWGVGIVCNGAENNCTLYADADCSLQVAGSPTPVGFGGYRCKDWDMLSGWCQEASHKLSGGTSLQCSQVGKFALAAEAGVVGSSLIDPTETLVETSSVEIVPTQV